MKIRNGAVALALFALLTSCSEKIDYSSPENETYVREFIKHYGLIDPAQDWNAASKGELSIRLDRKTSLIKVFAKDDNGYHLLSQCVGAKSDIKVEFDIPENVTDLAVDVDGTVYGAKVNGTVDCRAAASRTVTETSGYVTVTQVTDPAEMFCFRPASLDEAFSIVPEDVENRLKEGVVEDFMFKSDGSPMIIYPMYWNTNQHHRLGIYYYSGENLVKVPIYTDKDYGDDCQLQTFSVTLENAWGWAYFPGNSEGSRYQYVISKYNVDGSFDSSDDDAWARTMLANLVANKESYTWEAAPDGCGRISHDAFAAIEPLLVGHTGAYDAEESYVRRDRWHTGEMFIELFRTDGTYSGLASGGTTPYWYSGNTNRMRSKGIKINVPDGVEYGFYLELDITEDAAIHAAYSSECREGEDYVTVYSSAALNGDGDSYAATFHDPVNDRLYFAFEDYYKYGTHDLNDLVFTVSGVEKSQVISDYIPDSWKAVEGDPYTWLVAVEDLGAIGDFDFNDVVVGINAVTTYYYKDDSPQQKVTKLDFTALAAGGTLPIYLHFAYQGAEGYVAPSLTIEDGEGNPVTVYSSIDGDILYPNGKSASDIEFHRWFGNYSSSTMINTGRGATAKGQTSTIYINEAFRMTDYGNVVDGTIDGFYITVYTADAGAEGSRVLRPNSDKENGQAPQMFLILDKGPSGLNPEQWYWPLETMRIEDAYPGFMNWIGDAKRTDWHTGDFNRENIFVHSHR